MIIEPARIERLAAAAWPAAVTSERDGWLLRHTPGVGNRRSNSALPVGRWSVPAMERFYGSYRAPAIVQVSPAAEHAALDAVLDARGYSVNGRTVVMTASGVVAPAGHPVTRHDDRADWASLFTAVTGTTPAMSVIARIAAPTAVFTVAGRGIGLAVADPGGTGVFCMATHPDHRRRGIATAILAAVAAWAPGPLYLQVEEENAGARATYDRAGFVPSHRYHYRSR